MVEELPVTVYPSCSGIDTFTEYASLLPTLATESETSPLALSENETSKSVSPPTKSPAFVVISFVFES